MDWTDQNMNISTNGLMNKSTDENMANRVRDSYMDI